LALVQLLRRQVQDPDAGLWAESITYGLLQAGPEFARWAVGHPAPPGPPEPDRPAVQLERRDTRVTVVLDRPEVHNALGTRLRDELVDALRAVAADPTITEVVLRGDGPSFCSGGDLREFGTFPDPVTAHAIRSTRLPARAVAAVRDRLRAEVHGACVGAGVELAAFAARAVAAPGTTFRLPEVGMGLIPGSGGTWSVPARVGRQRAAWLALSGASIDAQTALDWGLIDEITE
jgi:enoyl-CoA hydratase/carnithine racemase